MNYFITVPLWIKGDGCELILLYHQEHEGAFKDDIMHVSSTLQEHHDPAGIHVNILSKRRCSCCPIGLVLEKNANCQYYFYIK